MASVLRGHLFGLEFDSFIFHVISTFVYYFY